MKDILKELVTKLVRVLSSDEPHWELIEELDTVLLS